MGSETDSLINRGDDTPKMKFENYVRPCLAELVGVTLFVFVGCMSVQDRASPTAVPSAPAVAVAHGFTIILLIVIFGTISGGHFNPAVTLGVCLAGGIKPLLALFYFLAQLIGGMLGAALCRGVLTEVKFVDVIGAGAHNLAPGVSPAQGILAESVLTTMLVMTVIMAAVDDVTKTHLAPLAIGFAVTCDILAGISTTGASMNPARSLGPAIALSYYNKAIWTYHYVYWVGPIIGSGVAGLLYRLFFACPEKRLLFKE